MSAWPAPSAEYPHVVETWHPRMRWSVRTERPGKVRGEANFRTYGEACAHWAASDLRIRRDQFASSLRFGPCAYW